MVFTQGKNIIPFEIKYSNSHTHVKDLPGLMKLCKKYNIKKAYIVTQSLTDFGPFKNPDLSATEFMKIPAALLCYWLGKFDSEKNTRDEPKPLF